MPNRDYVAEIKIVEGQMGKDVQARRGHLLMGWHGYDILACPACGGIYRTENHEITIADGKPTLRPSFGCPGCGAHFYVNAGKVDMLDFGYVDRAN